MAKKSLRSGLASLDWMDEEEKVKKPKATALKPEPKEDHTVKRVTLYMPDEMLDKIRALAFWERKKIKDVICDGLGKYLASKGEEYVDTALEEYQKSGQKK